MKYILVTGGVISGIGKGVTAASLGVILKHTGMAVTSIKIDPYINIGKILNHSKYGLGSFKKLNVVSFLHYSSDNMTPLFQLLRGVVYKFLALPF